MVQFLSRVFLLANLTGLCHTGGSQIETSEPGPGMVRFSEIQPAGLLYRPQWLSDLEM